MSKKIDWPNHIIEFITVVVGILLAFWLNNFNENRQDKIKATHYLDGIKKEIELNLKHVEERHKYHKELLFEIENNPLEVNLVLQLSKPKNYAWNLAQNETFKKYANADTYYSLAEIYSTQTVLQETNKDAGAKMNYLNLIGPFHYLAAGSKEKAMKFLKDEDFRIGARQGWKPVFQDINGYEEDLIAMYKSFLDNH